LIQLTFKNYDSETVMMHVHCSVMMFKLMIL